MMSQNIKKMMKSELFEKKVGSWYRYLKPILESEEMYELYQFLQTETKKGRIIYPYSEFTYNTFSKCSPDNLKLVICGSDPYPSDYQYENKLPHATGSSFDCSNSSKGKMQPSLEYFWEGISSDLGGIKEEYFTNELGFLEKQGVLLLNRTLTVEKDLIGSHKGKWDFFIKYFFETVLPNFQGVPIVLLGKEAKKMKSYVFNIANPLFILEHPSFSARNGQLWKTEGIFKKINNYLLSTKNEKIEWKTY